MPTYDYECSKCGKRFERFQSIMDQPIKKCPSCGKNAAKRLIGAGAGLIFRGSGFYCTDYKKNGSSGPSSSETKSAPDCANCPKKSADGKKAD